MTIVGGGVKHSRNQQHVFLRLLQAARGQYIPKGSLAKDKKDKDNKHLYYRKMNPLPCFPLHPNHVSTIPKVKYPTSSPTDDNDDNDHLRSSSPEDFHAHLCESIRNAKRRVKLATLYIGAGNGCMSNTSSSSVQNGSKSPREEELLYTLRKLSSDKDSSVEIKILMDASRALRPIRIVSASKEGAATTTSSAKEVFYSLFPEGVRNPNPPSKTEDKGISLFNVHRGNGFASSLPSPLNEILGVFHLKVYIIDDELILSGANLSEEYFTDRLDRYMSFVDGANGLVDFYSDLVDILMRHSTEYDPRNMSNSNSDIEINHANSKTYEDSLLKELSNLFDGNAFEFDEENKEICNRAFAYAVPTFQPSQNLFKHKQFSFPKDIDVVRNVLLTMLELNPNSSIYISSAYLNLTPFLMSAIEKFGKRISNDNCTSTDEKGVHGSAFLLTASPSTHGFKPKKKNDGVNGSGRGWIPFIYLKLAREMYSKIKPNGGKVLLYDRDGHTFHAKGMWLASNCSEGGSRSIDGFGGSHLSGSDLADWEISEPENTLMATVIGSSNFGSRSEILDIESNCIIVMNPLVDNTDNEGVSVVKKIIANDWNDMLGYCVDLRGSGDNAKKQQVASPTDAASCVTGFMQSMAKRMLRKLF